MFRAKYLECSNSEYFMLKFDHLCLRQNPIKFFKVNDLCIKFRLKFLYLLNNKNIYGLQLYLYNIFTSENSYIYYNYKHDEIFNSRKINIVVD